MHTEMFSALFIKGYSFKLLCYLCWFICSGLEDQLLGLVVAEERPDLEEAKNQLIVSNAKMKSELKEIEDKILERLSSSEGSPVDDIDLIATLEASKIKSQEITVNQPRYLEECYNFVVRESYLHIHVVWGVLG